MNSYSFSQACRPRGDFRIRELIEFLKLMEEGFQCPVIYDKNSKPVNVEEAVLQRLFEKKIDKLFPGIGVNVDFFSIPPRNRDDRTVRFEIHTGTHTDEIFVDSYDISIGAANKVPDLSYFATSIEILKPFEAYLSEFKNESSLNWYERQQAIPKFDKPGMVRGFPYLDEGQAGSLGGID